jgi:hypothetical protein
LKFAQIHGELAALIDEFDVKDAALVGSQGMDPYRLAEPPAEFDLGA